MSEEELRATLRSASQSIPEVMAPFITGPTMHLFIPATAPYCICGYCRVLTAEHDLPMNNCCGHIPCITQTPVFRNLCLRHDVIEVANILNWSCRVNISPSFTASSFRNQAYRNFTLWQQGKMGPGNRVPVTSCILLAIRNRFPNQEGVDYKGYYSVNEDD